MTNQLSTNKIPFTYTEPAGGKNLFTRAGDAYAVGNSKQSFAVADAPIRELTRAKRPYPKADIGGEVAQLFCTSFVEKADKLIKQSHPVNTADLNSLLKEVNAEIREFNISSGRADYDDPNNYDMGEVVAAAGFIKDNNFYSVVMEDCYINILDNKTRQNKLKTNYQIKKASQFLKKVTEQNRWDEFLTSELKETLPEHAHWEAVWCNYLRNNPNATEDGEFYGWGIFNGETAAETFWQVNKTELNSGDHILIFTDGFIPVLDNQKIKAWLLQDAKSTFKSQANLRQLVTTEFTNTDQEKVITKEKTLIYWKV